MECVNCLQLEAKEGSLSSEARGAYEDTHPLRKVTVMGVHKVSSVAFDGKKLDDGWQFDEDAKVLTVETRSLTVGGAWSAGWKMEWT